MKLSAQAGAIAPLLVISVLIIGIIISTQLVNIPQLFKSQAAYTRPTPPPVSERDDRLIDVSASCDGYGKLSLKWWPIPEAKNYTVRINRYPEAWAPDYSQSDAQRGTRVANELHGDRAFEAGATAEAKVNLGYGYFVGGTITADEGTVEVIPPFICASNSGKICIQKLTVACAPDSEVYCKSFPTPCDVPDDWITR